jgi:[ribosomal protein S18]-alanine N-acetyltransferase
MKKHVYRNNQIAATLEYTCAADEIQIIDIFVVEKYRRQGLGTQLIEELLREAQNYKYIILEVRAGNIPARKLYEKLGFAELYRREKYYHQPQDDALVLRRML